MKATINDMVITIDEILYNDLNRASREYEASVVDCYYYIINGGNVNDATFNHLFDEAVAAFYEYSKLKDRVSNEVVIPKVAAACDADPDVCRIYNTWNIPFDGSQKCTVSGINILEDTDTIVYSCDCPAKYVENVAKIKTRINILNEIISKLNSTVLSDFAEKSAKKLKDMRISMMDDDNANTREFMAEFVSPKIAEIGKDPENLTWTINVADNSFSLTESPSGSNITCTSCSACN